MTCRNCFAVIKPGGAKGLCGRCWKYERRHGELPPVARERRSEGLGAQQTIRLDTADAEHVRFLAFEEGIGFREWVRRAVKERIAAQLRTRLRAATERASRA